MMAVLEVYPYFTQLPDELQIKILGGLPIRDLLKATTVCHAWRRLAYDGSLWTSIDISLFYKVIPEDQLVQLAVNAGTFLKFINLRGCTHLTGHGLRSLAVACPNIQVVYLKDCRNVSTASIGFFLQNTPSVCVLDLSGLDSVSDGILQIIGSHLPTLEKLNVGWCRKISGKGIPAIAEGCTMLRHLKLNGCTNLDDRAMQSLGELPNLTHLCLSSCVSLNDTLLLKFLSRSTAPLTRLNLSSCARLSDTSLCNLALHSTKLTHLELSGCTLLTDHGFCFLAPRITGLVHLDLEDIQQITALTVKSLANHQPNLSHLCLSNCTQIADDAITHLVLHGVCHNLSHLELDNCIVTDTILQTIAGHLTQQKPSTDSNFSFQDTNAAERNFNVEVLDCSNITETGVRTALAKAGPLLTIKSFYLRNNEEGQDINHGRRYNSVGRQRRQLMSPRPSSPTCIIL
ncbi:hypothetical protein CLU79DRAFT_759400 [Phycomyces nitens]|nr:hypothetical protein CLU79DRAFT_759400 [Phycomyces nitens]